MKRSSGAGGATGTICRYWSSFTLKNAAEMLPAGVLHSESLLIAQHACVERARFLQVPHPEAEMGKAGDGQFFGTGQGGEQEQACDPHGSVTPRL